LLWFGLGCGRQPIEHLSLTHLETRAVAPGDALELTGEGLPPGLASTVELRGVLHAPGRDALSVRVSLPARVLSPERISAAVEPALFARWGRGSFEGELHLRGGDAASGAFDGSLAPVRFDVDMESATDSEPLRRTAESLLDDFGVAISDVDPIEHGLLIANVDPAGPAWRAHLSAGDTIEAANGVQLRALSDLAPGPSATSLKLRVRDAHGTLRAVQLPLASAAPISNPRSLALCLLACPALLLLLGFVPIPAPSHWLASALRRARALGARGFDRRLWLGLGATVAAAIGCRWCESAIDPFAVLLAHFSCLVALRAWRRRGLAAFVGQLAGLWIGVACVAANSGRSELWAIVRDQGVAPWTWNVSTRPPMTLAAWLCFFYAARLHGVGRTTGVDIIGRALLSALFAALFLGGSGGEVAPVLALLAIVLKAVACSAVLAIMASARGGSWQKQLAALAAALVATVAWTQLAPSRSFELTLGSGSCVFAAFLLGTALAQLSSQKRHAPAAVSGRPITPVSSL
jgi:hypothetical protein